MLLNNPNPKLESLLDVFAAIPDLADKTVFGSIDVKVHATSHVQGFQMRGIVDRHAERRLAKLLACTFLSGVTDLKNAWASLVLAARNSWLRRSEKVIYENQQRSVQGLCRQATTLASPSHSHYRYARAFPDAAAAAAASVR
jgi:hypothetical protein